MVLILALLLLLLWPAVAHAGPAEIAASLPDEASECRYLLRLCRQADDEPNALRAARDMVEIGKAAQVIRAKHDKMPACFKECMLDGRPMLKLNRFE